MLNDNEEDNNESDGEDEEKEQEDQANLTEANIKTTADTSGVISTATATSKTQTHSRSGTGTGSENDEGFVLVEHDYARTSGSDNNTGAAKNNKNSNTHAHVKDKSSNDSLKEYYDKGGKEDSAILDVSGGVVIHHYRNPTDLSEVESFCAELQEEPQTGEPQSADEARASDVVEESAGVKYEVSENLEKANTNKKRLPRARKGLLHLFLLCISRHILTILTH